MPKRSDGSAPDRIDSIISDCLHGIIENVQVIILTAELLKDEVGADSRTEIQDMIEQIINRANTNTQLISKLRQRIKELNSSKSA
jgi:hypothetical protein